MTHGAHQIVAMMRGKRRVSREVVECMVPTVRGLLSDLGAETLLDVSTSKRIILERVGFKVEALRTLEEDALSKPTLEERLAAFERIMRGGTYSTLCSSLRADLDKLGAWHRVPREIEALADGAGRLEALRRRFKTPALGPGQAEEPQPWGGAPRGPGAEPEPVLGPPERSEPVVDPQVGADLVEILDANPEEDEVAELEDHREEGAEADVGDGTACTGDAVVKWDEEVRS